MLLERAEMQRFWDKVSRSPHGCWEWQASTDTSGYGQFKMGGKVLRAHRVAYSLAYGMPKDEVIMHTCDNRRCVRPDHLEDATQSANILDAIAKAQISIPSQDHRTRSFHDLSCGNCGVAFQISKKRRPTRFCSRSCSVSYTNRQRIGH